MPHFDANIVAYLALAGWIPLTFVFFWTLRPAAAVTVSLLGAVLLLPEVVSLFDPPFLPGIDKHLLACMTVLFAASIRLRKRLFAKRPGISVGWLLFVVWFGAVGTALTNDSALVFGGGGVVIPAFTLYDAARATTTYGLVVLVPFVLARAVFRDEADLRFLLVFLVAACVLYSLPILVEVRLSPQFHAWTYGFHQHAFNQTIRGGGYRPMVFMNHGLALAMFVVAALICAVVLAKNRGRLWGVSFRGWAIYIAVILVVCKSLGAFVWATISVPLLLFARPRWAMRFAAFLGIVVLLFPLIRAGGFVPTDTLVELAGAASDDRAQSLQFRFDNEDALLGRALEKPLFGWGEFGRNRVYAPDGEDLSTTDGEWIIDLGKWGFWGFYARYLLLVYPIFLAIRIHRQLTDVRTQRMLSALVLIAGLLAIELLPNGLFSYLPLFVSGALAGIVAGLPVRRTRYVVITSEEKALPGGDLRGSRA